MSESAADRAQRAEARESSGLALGVWVVLHGLVVGAVAADYRISANCGAREIGLGLAVSAGIAGASLLASGLLRSNAVMLVSAGIAFLTIQFVGMFCGLAGAPALICVAQVWAWLAALKLVHMTIMVRWPVGAATVPAIYTIGTAGLWYCFSEFGAAQWATTAMRYASPLLSTASWVFWAHVGAVAAIGLAIVLASRVMRNQNCRAPQMPT